MPRRTNSVSVSRSVCPKFADEPDADPDRLKQLDDERTKAINEALDELLVEAFAVVREGGRRVLNMRHFDVQLIGGMVLHSGQDCRNEDR